MKHYLKYELNKNKKAVFIWALVVGAVVALTSLLYPAMAPYMKEMGSIPGFGALNTEGGWFASEVHTVISLAGIMFAVVFGAGLIASDYKNNSAVYVYTLPIKKTKIIFAKVLTLIISVLFFTAVLFLVSVICLPVLSVNFGYLVSYYLFCFLKFMLIGVSMFSLCMISSKFFNTGAIVGVAFAIFVLELILGIVADVVTASSIANLINVITPFGFVSGNILIEGLSSINLVGVLVWLTVTVILLLVSKIVYNKKDVI